MGYLQHGRVIRLQRVTDNHFSRVVGFGRSPLGLMRQGQGKSAMGKIEYAHFIGGHNDFS